MRPRRLTQSTACRGSAALTLALGLVLGGPAVAVADSAAQADEARAAAPAQGAAAAAETNQAAAAENKAAATENKAAATTQSNQQATAEKKVTGAGDAESRAKGNTSDPDEDENGGVDKLGGQGGTSAVKDRDNGTGNDVDCEDDNKGKGVPPRCTTSSPPPPAPPASVNEKITICHATGSATNPFEVFTIDLDGLEGHGDHEGDIIPAPTGAAEDAALCAPAGPGPGPGPDTDVSPIVNDEPIVEITPEEIPVVRGVVFTQPTRNAPAVFTANQAVAPRAAAVRSEVSAAATPDTLPFTGSSGLLPLLLNAMAALVSGALLLRLSRIRSGAIRYQPRHAAGV